MKNEDFYKSKFGLGEGPKVVGWDNEEKAVERYKTILGMIPEGVKSLADFGCGTGIFSDYVPDTIEKYTGYDLMPEYVQLANHNRATGRIIFRVGDVSKVTNHDCIVSIGLFTVRYDWPSDEEYQKYFEFNVRELLKKTNVCLILNAFSSSVDFKDEKLFYHDINSLFRIAKEEGFALEVNNHNSPYEFNSRFTRIKK